MTWLLVLYFDKRPPLATAEAGTVFPPCTVFGLLPLALVCTVLESSKEPLALRVR